MCSADRRVINAARYFSMRISGLTEGESTRLVEASALEPKVRTLRKISSFCLTNVLRVL